jgi:hypothetical protein
VVRKLAALALTAVPLLVLTAPADARRPTFVLAR